MLRRLKSWFRPAAPEEPRSPAPPAVEQWQVGDQAECINAGLWFNIFGHVASGPALGDVRLVTALCNGGCHLVFARWPGHGYAAQGFRKVTPRSDALDRAEPEFVRLIKHREMEPSS